MSLVDYPTLAEHLGTTVRHVRSLKERGEIPYVKVGHLVRFDLDEIERWLADKRVPARVES